MKKIFIYLMAGAVVGGLLSLALFTKVPSTVAGFAITNFITKGQSGSQTSTATSSYTFLSAGKATTTIVFDTGGAEAAEKAVMAYQWHASSTASELRFTFEYSQDGVDYYGDLLDLRTNTATSAPMVDVNQDKFRGYIVGNFASSTANKPDESTYGNCNFDTTATSTICGLVDVPTPLRYTRVKFYVPVGSVGGALWAEIMGRK